MNIDMKVLEAAQAGSRKSLSVVTEQAKPKVFAFLYRLTLDHHLAEDLCQETLLNLVKSIGQLNFPSQEAFWAWLFRTAQGKVQHHRRTQTKHRVKTESWLEHMDHPAPSEPMTGLFNKETVDTIFNAMKALRLDYRTVIVLRCMDEMSYAQISNVLGGTQLRNKMLFFRAKQALRHELAKKGLKRSHFLGSLAIFASVTSLRSQNAAGASTINAGLLNVGTTASILSLITSKIGLAAAAIALTFGLISGGRTVHSASQPQPDRYAHLMPLLQDTNFVTPSAIVGSYDPDRYGFTGIDPSVSSTRAVSMTCEEALVNSPANRGLRLILPNRHWVEVGFNSPIKDGPGPDLFYTNWNCPVARVFITNGAGRIYELPTPTCQGDCNRSHITTFDLAEITLPFTPQGFRILGTGDQELQLTSIRARLQSIE